MFIIKNALKSIVRSKGRNILIGIIVVVIAISSCISLSVRNAAESAKAQSLAELNITATISADMQKLMESADPGDRSAMMKLMRENQSLPLDEMQKYAESENVKTFLYTVSSSINGSGELKPVTSTPETENDDEQPEGPSFGMNDGRGGMVTIGMGSMGDFSITGYSSEDSMTQFIVGTSKITDGEVFDAEKADNTCIISKELATFNSLKTGDSITLANPNKEEETYELTICGIYENSDASDTNEMPNFATSMDPVNAIYTSYETLAAVIGDSADNADVSTDENTGLESTTALRGQTNGIYHFASPEAYEVFKTEVYSLGLSENYTVNSSDVQNYEQSLVPLDNLGSFAMTMLLIVLAIGGVILIVFNIFNIRERKFEVGVLTAIGMKKPKVAFQFLTELFVVTFASLIIGTAAGAVISVPVADVMLKSQIESMQQSQNNREEGFGRPALGGTGGQIVTASPSGGQQNGGLSIRGGWNGNISFFGRNIEYINKIDAAVNLAVIGQLFLIGLILTIISSVAGIVFIMRFEPLRILSERA